jgi:hypothetical protein
MSGSRISIEAEPEPGKVPGEESRPKSDQIAQLDTLKSHYDSLQQNLETLNSELLERGLAKKAVFVNSTLLRLRLWSADIDVNAGTLEVVEQVTALNLQTLHLLTTLNDTCDAVRGHVNLDAKTWFDYKAQFTQSVESLGALSEPIKTVSATNAAEGEKTRKGGSSLNTRINSQIRDSTVHQNIRGAGWILLEPPLPLQHSSGLLGSLVTNPAAPLDDCFPDASVTLPLKVKDSLVMKDVSMSSTRDRTVGLSLLGLGYSKSQKYGYDLQASDLRCRTVSEASFLFEYLLTHHEKEVKQLAGQAKNKRIYLIVGELTSSKVLKAQYELTSRRTEMISHMSSIGVSGDAAIEVPADVGFRHTREDHEVVFAVRCRVVKFSMFTRKAKLGGQLEHGDVRKGTLL